MLRKLTLAELTQAQAQKARTAGCFVPCDDPRCRTCAALTAAEFARTRPKHYRPRVWPVYLLAIAIGVALAWATAHSHQLDALRAIGLTVFYRLLS